MANSSDYDYGVNGRFDPKTGQYKANRQSTVLDPSPLATQRHGRSGHDESHPYGTDYVENDVAPARSALGGGWNGTPQGHRMEREDV